MCAVCKAICLPFCRQMRKDCGGRIVVTGGGKVEACELCLYSFCSEMVGWSHFH